MNEVMKNLLTRRSVRNFSSKPIPNDTLDDILKAAVYAPSAMNRQTWKFTAVCSQEKIQRLAAAIAAELDRKDYNMYNPAVLIIPSNDRDSKWGREDNACALENIFLAAHSYSVDSVWINQLQDISDVPKIREILNDFEIPENHVVYGMAALGYSDGAVEEPVKIGEINIIK